MKFKPKLALFDLDGTLIENEFEFFFNSALDVFHKLGFSEIRIAELKEASLNHNFFGFVPEQDRARIATEFWQLYPQNAAPPARLFDGVIEMLDTVATAGASIAIVTARSSLPAELQKDIAHTGIHPYVSHISTRGPNSYDWVDKTKQILEVCQHLSVHPAESVMTGDLPVDIVSAKQAKVGYSIAFLTGGVKRELIEIHEPDLITEKIIEIKDLFTNHLPTPHSHS